jgi:phage tail-like protein
MSDPIRAAYLLLDGKGAGWNTASITNLEAKGGSLRLAPLPSPAVPLIDAEGGFAGLENPAGVAVAANGDIYVSDTATHRVFRIRRCGTESCVDYVPCLGAEGSAPRKFRAPRGLAVSGDRLYVADSGNDRIQIFDVVTLKLLTIWPGLRNPSDVASDAKGNVWIADRGNARLVRRGRGGRRVIAIDGTGIAAHFFEVNYGPDARQRFVYVPLHGRLEQWRVADPAGPGDVRVIAQDIASKSDAAAKLLDLLHAKGARRLFLEWDGVYPAALESGQPLAEPSDLAIDREGRVFVIDRQSDGVRIFDAQGRLLRVVHVRADVPDEAFAPAAIAIDANGRLLLAGANGIHRYLVDDRPAYDGKSAEWIGACGGMSVDDRGRLFAAAPAGLSEIAASPGFERAGEYMSHAFDSGIDQCAWDRVAVTFAGEMPSTTAATIATFVSNDLLSDDDIAALDEERWRSANANAKDFLVLNTPGRYLWLRIRFAGDGVATPDIERIQLHLPRASYLQYLPAVYQADAVSRDLLDRFLRIFQTLFESYESKIDGFADHLDADGTPASFLEWLAGWIAMTFDGTMSESVRRKLLRHAPELYRIRGTPAGLQRFLSLAYGVDARVFEHFRLRKWAFLGERATLGTGAQLWGKAMTPRLQIDVFSRIGEAALISTGDPQHDPFTVHAHKFSVFVPASVVRSSATVAAVRTLIEREKPAHAQFDLVPVEPRFRLGVQSTLGLDAVVGAYPHSVLCTSNLGFDTLLGDPYGQRLRLS